MKKLFSALCASALAASIAVGGALPASAAPIAPQAPVAAKSDVTQVQGNEVWKKRNWQGNQRRNGNWNNNGKWNNGNWNNNGPKYGWYKGHRGYPYKRPGYRYYNGFWFPAGAFIAGAVIGGAIANNNNNNYGNSHVQWCYDRYRSYRAYDNTFQPYNGPRQQCYSPYS